MLHITVETITGRSFKIRVSPHETIYFVKVKICQLEGIPISHQILIWKSIELNNDHTLSSYNIPNNSTLKLTLTMKGGPINSVLTDEPSFQDMVEYLAEPGDIPSSSSSSSSLVSEKKRGALILYRYGNHSLKIASRDFTQPEAYSVEKWRVKFEDLKLKNERQVENNKLKGKMVALRKQMQKVALNKEKKSEPFRTISNEEYLIKEESNEETFDSHAARQSQKIISYQNSDFDDHKDILSCPQIKSSFISVESGNRLILSPAKDLEEPSEHLCSPLGDSKFTKLQSWCSEVPWAGSRSIRALVDLRHHSSSTLSVSSSSETNLEETSIDDEDDDEDDTSVLNTPNSTSFDALNEPEDLNNNNSLPEALEIPTNPRTERSADSSEILRERALDSCRANFSKFSGAGAKDDVEVLEKDRQNVLPKVTCETNKNLSSRIGDKLDALTSGIPSRSGSSTLQPRNPTFLDLLRSSRLREERKNLLFSKAGDVAAKTHNGLIQMSPLDLCNKGIKEGIHGGTKQKVEFLKKLEDDTKSSRESEPNRISELPKLPPLEPLGHRSFVAPQTSLSIVRRVPNSSNGCATKSQASEAKYSSCSYGLLPPIQMKNSALNSNQRCLPKLPSPTLSTRKESFSPFMKKRNGCLRTLNDCLKREQHVMFCASEDEEDAIENENACIEDNFPTLEIPGSLLSSDLSGCKVRVKKFVEGRRGLHSPNLNLMKMLEVVTRENQRSRLIGRRTGYIISTSSDPDADISKDLPASSLDSEKALETIIEPSLPPPKKKCAVCRKKTNLAASFLCRCGQNFCSIHRYPETHLCTIDYKTEGRKVLEERNPVVNAPKLPKI